MRYSYMTFIKLHTHNSQNTIIIKAKPLEYFMSGKKFFTHHMDSPLLPLKTTIANYAYLFHISKT